MPLPKSDKFEQMLASISVTRPSPLEPWKEFVAVPKRQVSEHGRPRNLPSISFWYRENGNFGIEAVLRKIVAALEEHAKHPARAHGDPESP